MEINVNQCQFDKICDQMKKDFGVIKKGDDAISNGRKFIENQSVIK